MARHRQVPLSDALSGSGACRYRHGPFAGVAVVLAWLAPWVAGAEIFKWTDENGKVHYSDAAPREGEAETIQAPPPPSDSAVLQSRNRLDGLSEQAAKWDQEREAEKRAKQTASREKDVRKQLCRQAEGQLRTLEIRSVLYYVDEQGKKIYLTDEERAARLEQVRKAVKDSCR